MELKKTSIDELGKNLKGGGFLFQNESESKLSFQRAIIYLSTFQRVGFKKCEIKNSSFTQCVFKDCYGRKGQFINVDFTGSTFVDCNFHGATFSSCTFKYCTFKNTDIPVAEIRDCLPTEYNLRNDLCRNLKVNYLSLGNRKASDIFLKLELKALQKELFAIFWGETSYYRQKYSEIERFKSFLNWVGLCLSKFFYGHGISIVMLIVSFVTITLILSLILFLFNGYFSQVLVNDGNETIKDLGFLQAWFFITGEAIKYSFVEYRPEGGFSKIIIGLARLIGVFYIGLISATLYRRIAR